MEGGNETMTETHRIIELRVSNGKAYVWDVADLALIRASHRICGVLTGTLPHVSQQNVFLGLPVLLAPEEAVLLLEKHLAVMVDDLSAHRTPCVSELKTWSDERRTSTQRAQLLAGSKGPSENALTDDAIQKRRAREEKRAANLRSPLVDPPTETLFLPADGEPKSMREAAESSPGLAQAPYTVTVPGSSSSDLKWYNTQNVTYTSIDAAIRAGIWTYPSDLHERAKCGVFRDLWEQGHYLGGGIKFGGDYLVYPGDPLRYHSHFVATVIDSPAHSVSPMEIVAHGRLGTATKKAHLLCSWDDQTGKVTYHSIEWAGFG